MWPSIKRWRDWAMDNLWPLYRIGPQPQALHYSYEKAGLVLHDQPIPWNAEAVLVEAQLRLPSATSRRKADFLLRLPGQEPIIAEQLRRLENDERYRVSFRLPPPGVTVAAEILFRDHVVRHCMFASAPRPWRVKLSFPLNVAACSQAPS